MSVPRMLSMVVPWVPRAAHWTRSGTVRRPLSWATVRPVAQAIWMISGIFAVRSPERILEIVD